MKILTDFFPILLFFIVYKLSGDNIYMATEAAIAVSVIQLIISRIMTKRFEPMQLITLAMIVLFGGATIIFKNPIFIEWKPSVLYWLFAAIFICGHFFGNKPIIQRLLESKLQLPPAAWKKMSISWIIFFIVIGFLNLYVAYHYSTNTWVNFKLFGVLGLTLLFVFIQSFCLAKHMQESPKEK